MDKTVLIQFILIQFNSKQDQAYKEEPVTRLAPPLSLNSRLQSCTWTNTDTTMIGPIEDEDESA